MKKALLTTLALLIAAPAYATDSGNAAFEILGAFTAEVQQTDFIKLQSSIDRADAMAIDAKLSKIYGEAKVTRAGLKVWEIENLGTGAEHTTIMCGPDGEGGIYISADRRGPTTAGAATQSRRSARPNARKAMTARRANARAIARKRSSERD